MKKIIDFGCGLEKDGNFPKKIWGELGMIERLRQVLPGDDLEVVGIDLERPVDFDLPENNLSYRGVSVEEARKFRKKVDAIVWNYPDPRYIYHGIRGESGIESPTVLLEKLIRENLKPEGELLLQTELPMDVDWYMHEIHKVAIETTRRMFYETGLIQIAVTDDLVYQPEKYPGAQAYTYHKNSEPTT